MKFHSQVFQGKGTNFPDLAASPFDTRRGSQVNCPSDIGIPSKSARTVAAWDVDLIVDVWRT